MSGIIACSLGIRCRTSAPSAIRRTSDRIMHRIAPHPVLRFAAPLPVALRNEIGSSATYRRHQAQFRHRPSRRRHQNLHVQHLPAVLLQPGTRAIRRPGGWGYRGGLDFPMRSQTPLRAACPTAGAGRAGRPASVHVRLRRSLGICFYLLFDPWVTLEQVGQSGLFAWMLTVTILTRAAMTLYHVPHMALGAELSEDYDERTVLVAIRHFLRRDWPNLGICCSASGFSFPQPPSSQTANSTPPPIRPSALTLGLLMCLTILISAFGTRARIPYLPQAQHTEKPLAPGRCGAGRQFGPWKTLPSAG